MLSLIRYRAPLAEVTHILLIFDRFYIFVASNQISKIETTLTALIIHVHKPKVKACQKTYQLTVYYFSVFITTS